MTLGVITVASTINDSACLTIFVLCQYVFPVYLYVIMSYTTANMSIFVMKKKLWRGSIFDEKPLMIYVPGIPVVQKRSPNS
jgi:hypothetical protein